MLSSAASESVLEADTVLIFSVPTRCCSPKDQVPIEPRRLGRNQMVRFDDKVLLLYNNGLTTYEEAMMGPDSVKWLDIINP